MPPNERAEPTCYCFWNGQISTDCGNATPCGTNEPGYHNSTSGTQLCCVAGDTCGANSICHSTSPQSSLYSSFYLGGCTDNSFSDPLCRRDCNDRGTLLIGADVVYDEGDSSGVWSCCGRTTDGTDKVDCATPVDRLSFEIGWTPDQFPGPVGDSLTPGVTTTLGTARSTATITVSGGTAQSGAQSGQVSTTMGGLPSPTATAANHDVGLSTGAKAGIGVGVALGALAVLGIAMCLVLYWKKRNQRDERKTSAPIKDIPQSLNEGYDTKPVMYHNSESFGPYSHELDGGFASYPHELSASPMTHELDSSTQPQHMMGSGIGAHQD